ncbi:MAG: hypothetical protein J6K17_00210 [Oscillospiraceae bacterium]|nr:hypothetical protein [Oscillospiraceae bacterium]
MNDLIKNQGISGDKINLPKIKGKTKIELFENGNKVSEVVETNMMTEYISESLNLPLNFRSATQLSVNLSNKVPIYDKLIGGVLLYADPVEEKTDNTRLSIANDCVGHAGESYSGNNSKRGSYNTNESGYIDSANPWKGYRHVFDFGTDKANGMISCVCLTPKISGNSGYGGGVDYNVTENNNDILYNSVNGMGLQISGESYDTIKNPRYLGNINGEDTFCYTSGNDLVVLRLPHDKLLFNLSDTLSSQPDLAFDKSNSTTTRQIDVYPIPDGLTTYTSVFVYDDKCYIVNLINQNDFSYVIFDPVTNSFSARQSRTVSPNYQQTIDSIGYCDGYWFASSYSNGNLTRYPASGGQGEETSIKLEYYDIVPFGKDVFFIGYNYVDIINAETLKKYTRKTTSSRFLTTYLQICKNFVLSLYTYQNSIQLSIYDFIGNISTINNLATPVTKTEAQTMKITYEVTAEEA